MYVLSKFPCKALRNTHTAEWDPAYIKPGLWAPEIRSIHTYVVRPVCIDHSRDQVMVVFIDRWYLYEGAVVSLRWLPEQSTVVTIERWSFYMSEH